MKRSYLSLALAGLLCATACSQDYMSGNKGGESVVTFTAELPADVSTSRAFGEGTTAKTLTYAVYEAGKDQPLVVSEDEVTFNSELKATVSLRLANGKSYDLVFWADAENSIYSFDAATKTITADYSQAISNQESYDAFYAPVKNFDVNGASQEPVQLYRPFAQLNIGTDDVDYAATPSMSLERRKKLYDICAKTGCKVKVFEYALDRMEKTNDPNASNQLRDIKTEDFLGRKPVDLDVDKVSSMISGKVVLVTGGGGSIGSELCRQIASMHPAKLIIVDIYENNAYDVQQELKYQYGDTLSLHIEIASVRDANKISFLFEKYKPNLVFHAAAHKHVPLMEDCGDEAILNNVFGTYNVAQAAEQCGAQKMILISTDKAVNPTNIMGASKRLCEMVIQSMKNSKTEFAAVRFGNVLGSNGSVIPLFRKQIEHGGPVTITDKRIIRYFMTIPEAVRLVMTAGTMASQSEIFVLDMGEPVKILDLAEKMIRLAGLKPYEDIAIIETGLRPGEKLYEELLIKTERLSKTENDKIFIEHETEISKEQLQEIFEKLQQAVVTHDNDMIRETVMGVVPSYKKPEEVNKEFDGKDTIAVEEQHV